MRTDQSTVGPTEHVIPVYAGWLGSWQISIGRRPLDASQLMQRYDGQAMRWDRTLNRLGVVDSYVGLMRQTLPVIMSSKRTRLRILDAGIGTGALSLALSRVLNTSADLDGIDLSSAMLAQAALHLSKTQLKLTLTQGDIAELPYADNSFDLVMSAHTLEHLPKPQTALQEFARVLRPGGHMLACITSRSAFAAYIQLKWRTHRVSGTQARQWFVDAHFEHVQAIEFGRGTALSNLSLGYLARKPVSGKTQH